jgi:hypothetical protein
MAEEKLVEFLDTGKEWSRLRTSVPGIFVLKLPAYKRSPSRLVVELNPVDRADNPTKRRGLVLRSMAELEAFNEVYEYDKLSKLLGMLEGVNQAKTGKGRTEEKVIEL